MYFWEFYRNHRSYYRNSPSFLKCSFKNTKNFGIIKLALRKRTIICCTPPFYPPKKLHEDEVIFVSRAFLTIPERQLHIHLYIYIHSFVNPASRNVFSWIRKRKRFNRNNRVATEWPVSLYSLQERVKQRGRRRNVRRPRQKWLRLWAYACGTWLGEQSPRKLRKGESMRLIRESLVSSSVVCPYPMSKGILRKDRRRCEVETRETL